MELQDENLYIERILDGETALFASFLERYSRPIYSLVVQIVSSPEDAEEVVQDVFLSAYRNLRKYRGASAFSTWLYRIAYNSAVSAVRKQKQKIYYIEESKINDVPDDKADHIMCLTDDEERIVRLIQAIDLLEPEEKALITLFYYEEKTVNETAEIMRLTPANVKVKLHRVRKKLYILMN